LVEGALDWATDWQPREDRLVALADVIERIEPELKDAKHYGDNRPGLFTSEHVPLLPDPFFTYWDLFQFGFFDPETRDQILAPGYGAGPVVAACGLLESDWAVRLLEEGESERATYVIGQAFQCLQVLDELLETGDDDSTASDAVHKALSHSGRTGGHASGEARLAKKQAQQTEAIRLYEQYRRERKDTPEHGLPDLVARKMQLGRSTIYAYLKAYRAKASKEALP
jgi:hypothetical protein